MSIRSLVRAGTVSSVVGLCLLVYSARGQTAKAPYDVGRVPQPHLFAEGIVSTRRRRKLAAPSVLTAPESLFRRRSSVLTLILPRLGLICVSYFRNGKWTQPEVVPFSGRYLDFPPKISPDGKTMYFSSSRPAPGKAGHALRIWSVPRTAAGWGEPALLPAPVNAPDDAWNWSPSVTRDGTLYFTSNRDGGSSHIYRSRFVNGAYTDSEKLGPEINSEFNESDPYISPDEKILIFAAAGSGLGEKDRAETLKGGGVLYARADFYISVGNQDGHWSQAKHLEHGINSTADESAPSITPDGKYLFFSSERSFPSFTVPTTGTSLSTKKSKACCIPR